MSGMTETATTGVSLTLDMLRDAISSARETHVPYIEVVHPREYERRLALWLEENA